MSHCAHPHPLFFRKELLVVKSIVENLLHGTCINTFVYETVKILKVFVNTSTQRAIFCIVRTKAISICKLASGIHQKGLELHTFYVR